MMRFFGLKYSGFLILLLINIQSIRGQHIYSLRIHATPDVEKLLGESDRETLFGDTLTLLQELDSRLSRIQSGGYLQAFVRDRNWIADTLDAWIAPGPQYHWKSLKVEDNVAILEEAGFKEKHFIGEAVKEESVFLIQDKILTYAENHGYPFARISLTNIELDSHQVSALMVLEKERLVTIDSLRLVGSANISSTYLEHYLGIHPGDIYNESVMTMINKRLRELPFVEMSEGYSITFVKNKAVVNLFLKDKKASRFNFIIGVLPNNDQKEGKLLITGEAMLQLINPFGTGKQLFLQWKGLQPKSPEFQVQFIYPYLLGLPVGVDARLQFYKRDSTYFDFNKEIGLQYLFIGKNYLKAYYQNRTVDLLSVDTSLIKATHQLPATLDVVKNIYGLVYHYEQVDYHFNPREGIVLSIDGHAGVRNIRKNPKITALTDPTDTSFDFASLYSAMQLQTLQLGGTYDVGYYWPLGKRATILTKIEGGIVNSPRLLYNDLFRIGGNELLRGFDEEAYNVSMYHVATLEYRYLLGRNAYFQLFADGGYLQSRQGESQLQEFVPIGFGTGVAFDTPAGVFQVSGALGNDFKSNSSVQFRNVKIHFGYVSYF